MKTFKDLEFKPHSISLIDPGAVQAKMTFDDGTEISVITGSTHFYCGAGTYEMMSSRARTSNGVRGWLTPDQITKHMIYVQKNPKSNKLIS